MKKFIIPKLIGLCILTKICLVAISFLEVAIYSYLINPGQPESFYSEHANISAPYISAIGGFFIFFLVSYYWKKKQFPNAFKLAILFPIVYIVLDVILTTSFGLNWAEFYPIFLLANAFKFIGSLLGNKLF